MKERKKHIYKIAKNEDTAIVQTIGSGKNSRKTNKDRSLGLLWHPEANLAIYKKSNKRDKRIIRGRLNRAEQHTNHEHTKREQRHRIGAQTIKKQKKPLYLCGINNKYLEREGHALMESLL